MAFTNSSSSSRSPRTGYRKYFKRRYVANPRSGTVYTKRRQGLDTFTLVRNRPSLIFPSASAGNFTSVAVAFHLNDLPQFTELVALWDLYKINFVEIWIRPLSFNTSSTTVGAPTVPLTSAPLLECAFDYDGNPAPSTSSTLTQRQSYRRISPQNNLVSYFKISPCFLRNVYRGSTSADGNEIGRGFLSTNGSADTPHYGFLMFMAGVGAVPNLYSWDVQFRYNVTMKSLN